MAIIADLTEPYTLDALDEFQPLPIGALVDVITIGAPDLGVSAPYVITNRFPVPPTAIAFLTDVNAFELNPIVVEGLGPPYYLNGALSPSGIFLEPTTGQIWPRIG